MRKATHRALRVFVATLCLAGCVPEEVGIYGPPPGYIATTVPVYYQGQPTYWYGGRWVYRDPRGGWGYYRAEPRVLAERRMGAPPVRRSYERGRSRR